ncbi:hypothetical protein E3P92_02209 [Wallemia ichthyophaga]|nr:hypothetical protein E3P91_01960 [Wallemia ichthyophaga]TIB13645.1 hypothetical protein E3P92_02209 [Wallemia ichthyophaga]
MGKFLKKHAKGRIDKYYRMAKDRGYRSRAYFKLAELNKRFNFIEKSRIAVDLGAAPGSWLQNLSSSMPHGSLIIGVDLVPIVPIPRVTTFVADLTTQHCKQLITNEMKGNLADLVVHDGAPNVGAAWLQDAFAQNELVLASLKIAAEILEKGGTFVTKVFRSKDYNNLMWVFNQLFKNVNATKPNSSRLVSAELFVVCQDFIAPQKLDPRFLDPKYVFKDIAALASDSGKGSAAANAHANVFMPEKKTRKREGYEEGNYLQFKPISATDFIESTEPVTILGTHNAITFKSKEDKKLLKNEDTTDDIKANCEDLKVLGKKEFKQLMKWRLIIREEMGLEVRKKDIKEDVEDAGQSKVEEHPMNQDEQIAEEIERIENEDSARARKERRRRNEKRAREVQRMQLKMGAPLDIGLEQDEQLQDDVYLPGNKSKQDMFDLKHSQKHIKGRNLDEMDEDDASSEEEIEAPKFEDAYEDEEDKVVRLESQMDGMYEKYQEKLQDKDRKHQVKEARRKDKNREAWGGIPRRGDDDDEDDDDEENEEEEEEESEGEHGYDAKEKRSMQLDQDSSDEEEENAGKSKKSAKKPKKADNAQDEAAASVWFGNPLFNGADGIDEESEEEEDDKQSEDESMEEDEKPQQDKEEDEESDGFEVVPQEDDGQMWDVDDEDQDAVRQKRIEDTGLITEEAMSMAYRLKNGMTTKQQLIDDGFNKNATNDRENLPDWFTSDERKNYKVHVPITKEAVDALKARQRAIDARPIKKLAEAKAKKKYKATKAAEKAAAKAETVMENQELTEKEKAMGVQKMINKTKANANKKREVKLVVAKGAAKGVKGRPKGVSGRYRMVDRRFKTDIRGMRNAKRRAVNNKKRRNVDTPPNGSFSSFIRVNDIVILCPFNKNVDYFGKLNESVVRNNFDIIYQLMEEILDNGFPVTTETAVLSDIVVPPSTLSKLMSSAGMNVKRPYASPITWRKAGVKHNNNEIFFNVIESIDAIVDKHGNAVMAEINGQIECDSRLSGTPDILLTLKNSTSIEKTSQHACIRYQRWIRERVLSFVPPDGRFRLISFEPKVKPRLPISSKCSMKVSPYEGNFEVILTNTVGKKMEGVELSIFLGHGAVSARGECKKKNTPSGSKATSSNEFDHVTKIFKWNISHIEPTSVHTLTANFKSSEESPRPETAFGVNFRIPQHTASGVQIDGVKIAGDAGYKPYKGFKGELTSGSYEIQARDARIPLTGINYQFEKMIKSGWSNRAKLGGITERIVVYTKRDLAEERYEGPLIRSFKNLAGQHVVFTDSKNDKDPRVVQRQLVSIAKEHDVPKLNVLVTGKAAITGSDPGVTRKLTGTVKINEDPNVYIYDTPGIMVPFLGHDEMGLEMGLKLALTSGIKPDLIETETILDYLLYKLNLRDAAQHSPYQSQLPLGKNYPPTNDIYTLLEDLGRRIGALRKGGIVDIDNSSQFLINAMRHGKFGRWTLDDFPGNGEDSVDSRVHSTLKTHIDRQQHNIDNENERRSKSSILKQEKREAAVKRKEKHKKRQ